MNNKIDFPRATNSVLYILEKLGGLCETKIIFKILYLADQMHLSKYGRSITSDNYMAKDFGPVPVVINNLFESTLSENLSTGTHDDFRNWMHFVDNFILETDKDPNLDYLSESDIEGLDSSLEMISRGVKCAALPKSRGEFVSERMISIEDILSPLGDTQDYIEYIEDIKLKNSHSIK